MSAGILVGEVGEEAMVGGGRGQRERVGREGGCSSSSRSSSSSVVREEGWRGSGGGMVLSGV